MSTGTKKTKKAAKATKTYSRSFVCRGIKITPRGTGTSRIAREFRKGLEEYRHQRQAAAHDEPN